MDKDNMANQSDNLSEDPLSDINSSSTTPGTLNSQPLLSQYNTKNPGTFRRLINKEIHFFGFFSYSYYIINV